MATQQNLPKHVAIIMDGNGRWAELQGKRRTEGHHAGAKVVRKIVEAAAESGVRYLTLYAFSTENWNRKAYEREALMRLFKQYTKNEPHELAKQGIAVRFLGEHSRLAPSLQQAMKDMETITALGDRMLLQIAFSYGGRDEIVRAVNKLRATISDADEIITEVDFSLALDTASAPDVDLLIRPGAEMRLSGFLLWQAAYAELRFRDELWPDYTSEMFREDLAWYASRQRRFGLEAADLAAE